MGREVTLLVVYPIPTCSFWQESQIRNAVSLYPKYKPVSSLILDGPIKKPNPFLQAFVCDSGSIDNTYDVFNISGPTERCAKFTTVPGSVTFIELTLAFSSVQHILMLEQLTTDSVRFLFRVRSRQLGSVDLGFQKKPATFLQQQQSQDATGPGSSVLNSSDKQGFSKPFWYCPNLPIQKYAHHTGKSSASEDQRSDFLRAH